MSDDAVRATQRRAYADPNDAGAWHAYRAAVLRSADPAAGKAQAEAAELRLLWRIYRAGRRVAAARAANHASGYPSERSEDLLLRLSIVHDSLTERGLRTFGSRLHLAAPFKRPPQAVRAWKELQGHRAGEPQHHDDEESPGREEGDA